MKRAYAANSAHLSCSVEERDRVAKEVMAKIGPQAHFVSSCNHPHIMAGQGTLALEFLEKVITFRMLSIISRVLISVCHVCSICLNEKFATISLTGSRLGLHCGLHFGWWIDQRYLRGGKGTFPYSCRPGGCRERSLLFLLSPISLLLLTGHQPQDQSDWCGAHCC